MLQMMHYKYNLDKDKTIQALNRYAAECRGYRIEKGVSHVTIKVKEGQTLGDQAAPSQA